MTDSEAATQNDFGGLIERLQIRVTEVSPRTATATMPVEGNTQPHGQLHGGASAALAETVGSLAAMAHAGTGNVAVGVDLSITHHKAVSDGFVVATARALHLGGTVATYEIEVVADSGARVASARLTCYLKFLKNT